MEVMASSLGREFVEEWQVLALLRLPPALVAFEIVFPSVCVETPIGLRPRKINSSTKSTTSSISLTRDF